MSRQEQSRPQKIALFDIGGVLTGGGPDIPGVARVLGLRVQEDAGSGVPGVTAVAGSRPAAGGGVWGLEDDQALARVKQAVWTYRDQYDLGASEADYWGKVAKHLGLCPISESQIQQLRALDLRSWQDPFPGVVELLHAFRDQGYVLGVLSNASHTLADAFRAKPWAGEVFTYFLFSAQQGLAKPDPASYRNAVAKVGADHPGQVAFFDDRIGNVEAACQVGLDAHCWQGTETGLAYLQQATQ